ncbi:HlyD family secretion protein [Breoghania corrubedonensis]|uniref:Membrane fusion protein (MFP) family protein n=1 Tax=Breoghania corrubedonensis TaxID=665038 RepID=A0A2T5V6I1_9HYPH|nr:HlyD family type I secretion periplasmic adaptor subunit [Breoghania corrubedonensis]PTW59364.1 HlyD family secretion protein [Breoghania corrubedonensis]
MGRTEPARAARTGYRTAVIVGLVAFVLLFAGGFGWMAFASLSGAVVAEGSVIVRGKAKSVQHLDGGIVEAIEVENGDLVKAGDVLVRLDETLLRATLEIARNRLREAAARRDRLQAERDGLDVIVFDDALVRTYGLGGEDEIHREGQRKIFEARRATREGEIAQQREKIARFANQIAGVKGQIAAKQEQLSLIEEELAGLRTLEEKGLTSRTRVMAQARARANLVGQISEHRADLARIENSIRETEISILQVERQFREQVLSELREASTTVDDLVQQIVATDKQLERVDIRAPIDGIVHELNVHTIGGVVPPGGTLMQLIPVGGGLEVEVAVQPQFIDQIYREQTAAIRFPAFNQRTTPEIFGVLTNISPASIVNEKTGRPFYRVEITISEAELARLGALQLLPGMPVEAFIETKSRTVLSYLIKPLSDQFNRALRED